MMADRPNPDPQLPTDLPVIPIAGRGVRLLCAALDFAIIYALSIAILSRFFPEIWNLLINWQENANQDAESMFQVDWSTLDPSVNMTVTLLLGVVIWLYFFISESFTSGGSLGKSVFGLRVLSMRGTPPSPMETGVRASIKALCFMLSPLLLLSIFMILLNRQRRSAHDFMARTLVIAGRPPLADKAGGPQ